MPDQSYRTEKKVISNESAFLKALLETAVDAIVTIKASGKITSFNPAAERIFGCAAQDVIGRNVRILMPETYACHHDIFLRNYLEGGEAKVIGVGREVTGKRADGSEFPMELSVSEMSVSGERMFVGIVRDVTARRVVEQSQRDREARFRAIWETSPNAILTIDSRGCIDSFNPSAEALFGYKKSELEGHNIKRLMPKRYSDHHDGYIHAYLEGGDAKVIGIGREVTGQRKDGSEFPMHLTVTEMEVAGKRMFTGTIEDLTARKQAEMKAADSQSRIEAVLNTAVDSIVTIQADGTVESFNKAAETMFGYPAAKVIGKNISMLMPEQYAKRHDGYLQKYLAGGDAKVIGVGREVVGKRADGSEFPMELAVSEMVVDGMRMFTGIVRDITERKAAEKKLQEANEQLESKVIKRTAKLESTIDQLRQTQDHLIETEKMASLGSLVAGVSHEINTPVGVGLTAATTLTEDLSALRKAIETGALTRGAFDEFLEKTALSSEIITSNLVRTHDLVRSFKQVAIDQTHVERRRFKLHAYLDEIIVSLRPQLKRTEVAVLVDCDEDLEVETFPGAIAQIVTNLINNSLIHAYPDTAKKGVITISATKAGKDCLFEYHDDGAGMSADVAKRIFDPFFTTRRGQGGTGLGMNIVYNLATVQMGGTIRCESEQGAGTRFYLKFKC